MRRTPRLLLVAVAVALATAACSSSSESLATVNGTTITRSDLVQIRPSYQDPASVDVATMRTDLTALIVLQAVRDAAEAQFGIVVTDADIDERVTNPPPRYVGVLVAPDAGADVGDFALRADATTTLLIDDVVPRLLNLDPETVGSMMETNPEQFAKVCVRHISVATEEEANDVMDRLANGEDFLDLVAEVSTDTTSPGGLISSDGTCPVSLANAPAEMVSAILDAPLDEPVGPVESNGEWHILSVEQRDMPASVQAFIDDPLTWLDWSFTTSVYADWFNAAVTDADISVSPTVGTWSQAASGISPPGE
jgi:foldase protein PrsA